jgi:hypothetical protein
VQFRWPKAASPPQELEVLDGQDNFSIKNFHLWRTKGEKDNWVSRIYIFD